MDEKRPVKSNKKTLGVILFVLLNVGIIGYTAYSEWRKGGTAQNFFTMKVYWRYLIPAAGCFVAAITAEISKYAVMMRKLCGYVSFKTVFEVTLLGRYYDNITPSGIGGQPFQIYYLCKRGISAGDSAVMPIAAFINMQTAFALIAVTTFIFNGSVIDSPAIRIAAYFGVFFYMGLPLIIIAFTLFPVWMEKAVRWCIKLGAKMKLVKSFEATQEKSIATLTEYRRDIISLASVRGLELKLLFFSLIYQCAMCSLPYFVIRMFGGTMSWPDALTTTFFIYAAIAFIPTPGNAGAAEGSFYLVFSMLTVGRIFWAMLAWRFFCYYIFIIIGICIYAFNYVSDRRKLRR